MSNEPNQTKFEIQIISEDDEFAFKQSKNLRLKMQNDDNLQDITVKQGRKEYAKDEAGGGLMAILQVVAGAALEPIAKTIQVWMQERTKQNVPEFSIELDPDGNKFKISSKNIGADEQEFILEVVNRFKGNKNYDYKITESS